LGCWLFAFFVAVAHACGPDEGLYPSRQVLSASADTPCQSANDAGCGQFSAENLPVPAKLQLVQDQRGEQALLLPPSLGGQLMARLSPAPSRLHRAPLPSAASLNTRYVRLAL
jgi:hypothetical protein